MANDPQSLLTDSSCFLCYGLTYAQAMDLQLLANKLAAGGLCTIPGPVSAFHVTTADTTNINFALALPIPQPTIGTIIRWGTTAGGPYTNSKSFAIGDPLKVGTADGLVAGTLYYFVAFSNNGGICVSTASAEISQGLTHPSALAWKNAVIAAGGGTPSNTITAAYSDFFYGLDADGFTYTGVSPDIVFFNAFYPTSIIGAMVPQIDASGVIPWTNRNFVIGDLTVDGLKGNGTNKSIGTGMAVGTLWGDNSAGLSAMVSLAAAENTYDIGVGGNNFNSQFGLQCNWSDTKSYFECWRFDAPNFITGSPPASPTVGFWCASRTASNAGIMYFAKTGSPIASIGTMAGAQTGAAAMGGAQTLEIFALTSIGVLSNWTTKRLSMVAGHKAFTLAQATKLFNRSQTLRTALGGGSV